MSVWTALARLFQSSSGAVNGSYFPYRATMGPRLDPVELPPAELYRLLKILYLSADSYGELARANVAVGRRTAEIKGIRSPIVPVVSWFSQKTFPKPLTIVTEHPDIIPAIEQVWTWSNWRARQSTAAGWAALYGESWLHVQASPERGRVWFEALEPEYVTDFAEDERGFVQFVRIDIPKHDATADGGTARRTHTETWSAPEQVYRRWETDGDTSGRKLADLGQPAEEEAFSTFGITFVPFVRTVFSDIGETRGIGAVQLALEAIFEADLSASALHELLYVQGDGAWVATAAGNDPNGRPIPPLRVAAAAPTFDSFGRQTGNGTGQQADGEITVGKRSFWRLPGGYDLKSVVPDIQFDAALAILKDHDAYLERLMPALSYSKIAEISGPDLSGRALRYKLSAAVDQLLDVRATALEKLAQADAMALTLGAVNGIPGFEGLGTFEAGDFVHEFEDVQVIPVGDNEESQTTLQQAQAFAAFAAAGLPLSENLVRTLGITEEEATAIVQAATAETEASMERQAAAFGGQPPQQGDGNAA